MKTKLYGHSDDLIEIEGAIEEEFYHNDKRVNFTASDGTKGSIKYEDGEYLITLIEEGSLAESIIKSVGDDAKHSDPDAIGCSSYSDVLVFSSGLEWLRVGRRIYYPAKF